MPFTRRLSRRLSPRLLPVLLTFATLAFGAESAGPTQDVVSTDLGTFHLMRPDEPPKGLVLFLAGSNGWDQDAVTAAKELANQDHLVVGIDWQALAQSHRSLERPWWDVRPAFHRFLRWIESFWSDQPATDAENDCWDASQDLARIADWVEAHETLPKGALPILVGQGDGAAIAYVGLLQAPAGRYHAAATLGFCPRWPAGEPKACRRGGLTDAEFDGDQLLPAAQVPSGWFLFDAATNAACPNFKPADFARQVANARIASNQGSPTAPAPPVDGEPQLSPLESLFQWLDPSIRNQVSVVSAEAETAGLPLIEVRAKDEDPKTFAIMLSGDGGWADLDRALSKRFAERGISTVGWDSLSYFWKQRTPIDAGRDLARVVRHYLHAWHKDRVMLVGYSFGAEVLPFMANRLPLDLRSHVDLVALLSVGQTAMFQFHLSDWLDRGRGADALKILPEVRAMDWTHRFCVYGEEDDGSGCPGLASVGVTARKVPGDHHFNEDYPGVADLVLAARPGAAPAMH